MRKLLIILGILLIPATCLNACSEKYICRYYISDICADRADNMAYLEFELDEDEILHGKISVDETFASVEFFYSEPDLMKILKAMEDPVIVGPMSEYVFSIQAKSATRVRCYILYKNWPGILGSFYCSVPSVNTWVENEGSPYLPWDGPTMHSVSSVNWGLIILIVFFGIPALYLIYMTIRNELYERKQREKPQADE